MASRFRACVAISSAVAVGILLVASHSWTNFVSQPVKEHLEPSSNKSVIEASGNGKFSQQFAEISKMRASMEDEKINTPGQSAGNLFRAQNGNRDVQKASPNDEAESASPLLSTDSIHRIVSPTVAKTDVTADAARSAPALKDCITASKVFSDKAEVETLVRVLQQFRDLTPAPDENEMPWVPPRPLVFTQMRQGDGIGIAEAFHHAWSVALGCGKMFFTKTEVRVRAGREKCFSLFASAAAPHLYPWGFFDPDTRKQKVPDLEKIVGIRGNLPFGACRFLGPDCSYTTALLEPFERYLSHIQSYCSQGTQSIRECDLSLNDFTHAAVRGDISLDGLDNYQTRLLAGDGSLDSNNLPCFSPDACTRIGTFKVGPSEVRAAIRNLVFHYPVWGISDDLPSFAQRLQRVYGYPFYHLNKKRASTDLEPTMNLTLDTVAKQEIEQMNAADETLYRFARCVLDAGSPRFAF